MTLLPALPPSRGTLDLLVSIRSLKHSELVAVVRNESICKILTGEIVTVKSIVFIELSLEGINKTSIRVMVTWYCLLYTSDAADE